MARMFDPGRSVVSAKTRVIEARQILSLLGEHDVATRLKVSFPKGTEFIEDMAVKFVLEKDPLVTEKQLEFLRGLCERNVGHLPEDEDPKRRRRVAWKR